VLCEFQNDAESELLQNVRRCRAAGAASGGVPRRGPGLLLLRLRRRARRQRHRPVGLFSHHQEEELGHRLHDKRGAGGPHLPPAAALPNGLPPPGLLALRGPAVPGRLRPHRLLPLHGPVAVCSDQRRPLHGRRPAEARQRAEERPEGRGGEPRRVGHDPGRHRVPALLRG